MTRPIFLIGYMACGKTTLGEALAAATGRRFIDLDRFIETTDGRPVSRIFAEDGESRFRVLERDALRKVASATCGESAVVACGGGTPCFGGNMELMNASGITVWLTAPVGVIVRRLLQAPGQRPLVAGISDTAALEEFVSGALRQREEHYSKAMHRFDSSLLETPEEVEGSVNDFITGFL